MQLNPTGQEAITIWDDLPLLTEYNPVAEPKSGAIVLIEGDGGGRPVILASQRYGRGRTMAFTTSSSWRWQMGLPSEDLTHETFWRQILRWLVSASPDPVAAYAEKDSYVPGETVRLYADVSNSAFERLNDADVTGRVIDPDGNTQIVRFEWTGLEDGTYQALVSGSVPGIYTLEVDTALGSQTVGRDESTFQIRDRPVEFYDAALDRRFLESVADQSGGRYYPLGDIGRLPDDAVYFEGESAVIEQRELWDVPALFMLLALTLGGEWFWRKKKGFA
jgi:hypothetical protein